MKSKEFILEAKKPKVTTPKPRNFVAKNAPKAGAGAHKNKKKAAKQGEVKHKSQMAEGNEPDEQYLDKVISDLHKDALGMRPDREFGREWMSSSYEEKLEIYNNMLKNLHSDMDEATGDEKFDTIMRRIKKGTKKQATADRREREADSRQKARNAFGPSPADRLSIRSNKDVEEASDWGEPREILEDVLQTLEREVEWPLTEVMDPKEVRQLLSPIIRAVNDKLLSMDRDGNQ